MVAFDASTPAVSEWWRIRNDGDYSVAYRNEADAKIYHVLSPPAAVVAPLCNGAATLSDIRRAFIRIFSALGSHRDWSILFDRVMEELHSFKDFLCAENGEGVVSPSLNAGLEHLIPDLSRYRFPVHRLLRPVSITIGFTNRCACDCLYCYAERRVCAEKDLDEWRGFLDEMVENEITRVSIGGGDIFMRRDALEILRALVDRGLFFSVSTKSLITAGQAERLEEMGIGRDCTPSAWKKRPLQISVDSAKETEADLLTRRPGYLPQTSKTLENLAKAGIYPQIKAVLTSFNADAAEGIVRRFVDAGIVDFYFAQYSRSYYRHDERLFLNQRQKNEICDTVNRLRDLFPNVKLTFQNDLSTGGPLNLTHGEWRTRPACSGGQNAMTVRPNGDVVLCEEVPHDDLFIMGNVFEQGLLGCWRSPEITKFLNPPREKFAGTVCFDCGEFDECRKTKGYCFRNSLRAYGTIYEAPPECPYQLRMPPRII